MSAGLIALLFGIGVSGWTYHKVSHRTGHIVRTSVIVAVFVGLIAMFVFYTLFNMFVPKN
ncbi:MAG TPA: hypothetical protein VMR95_00015 [Candidatus Binatia bacterium]|nr:hypothetical protein [Candidatus Binatia bacterium]